MTTEAITGLEAALRDAANRSLKPDTPLLLAFALFRSVVGLARSLRQYRQSQGMPPHFSPELSALLTLVLLAANARVANADVTDAVVCRLFRVIEGLARAAIRSLPTPEKAKKPAAKASAALSPATNAPPPPARRRANEWDNIGAIAIRTLDAGAFRDPILAQIHRNDTDRRRAA